MTIAMVQVVAYVRKNPGASFQTLMDTLKLSLNDLNLALAALNQKGLISIDTKKKVFPETVPA